MIERVFLYKLDQLDINKFKGMGKQIVRLVRNGKVNKFYNWKNKQGLNHSFCTESKTEYQSCKFSFSTTPSLSDLLLQSKYMTFFLFSFWNQIHDFSYTTYNRVTQWKIH